MKTVTYFYFNGENFYLEGSFEDIKKWWVNYYNGDLPDVYMESLEIELTDPLRKPCVCNFVREQ